MNTGCVSGCVGAGPSGSSRIVSWNFTFIPQCRVIKTGWLKVLYIDAHTLVSWFLFNVLVFPILFRKILLELTIVEIVKELLRWELF